MTYETSSASAVAETYYVQLFEAMPGNNMLLKSDAPKFTIVSVTPSFLEQTDTTKEGIIGKGIFEAFPSNESDPAHTGLQDVVHSFTYVLQHKKPHDLPVQRYDLQNEDGSFIEKYWKVSHQPFLSSDGAVAYIIQTSADITEQVKLQKRDQQLNDIEKAFRLFMHAPMVVGLANGDDYVLELANEEAFRLWGKGKEILGKPIFQSLPELKGQGIFELFEQVRASGEPYIAHEVPVVSLGYGQEQLHYFNLVYQPYYSMGSSQPTGVFTISHDVTEQVRARQKVQAAVQELQFVTDTLPQLVWATEADGYSYFFNKVWLEYTGLALEDVLGNGWMQSLHPEDLDRTRDAWTQAYKNGAVYEIEYRLKRYDGVYRWFLARGTPMKDEKGQIQKWYGSTTDIDEQKRNAEALQFSTERFDLVAKATQDAIWDWNLLTNEIWWNDGFKELFGYSAEEIEPTVDSWYNRVHPDDTEWVIGGIHEVIDKGGSKWSGEYRFRRKDGSYATVFDRGYALHDPEGRPYRMLGSMQDISEQKQAEQALRSAHEHTTDILESTADAFYALDAQFHFTYVNQKAAQLWGRDRESLLGKHYWTEFPKAVGSESYDMHYQVLQEGKPAHYETISPLLNFWIHTSIYPSKDGGLSVFFHDISERKQWQQQLQHKVEERTQALAEANEALRKTNDELKRSNQNLEQFAYAASHDLKEPMRKIQIFSDRLKERLADKLEADDQHYFSRIIQATQRMNILIDDLLLYSHVSSGAVLEEQINLNDKVKLVLEDLEVEIAEKKASVTVDPLPTVRGHRRQLQQLFQNLIGNAIKYAKPGVPPQVHISSRQVQPGEPGFPAPNDKAYHLIEVSDNGIGFSQEDALRIFNVFTRLHGMAEYKGTGVGLSIAQKVVENHGGAIWAEGIPDAGARFKVLLPA